ncbi:MAG: hypothetical protein IT338_15795 [Thermomicrobiales bacterium]|nr:hypothetical protein [Thermomicrobiales bacterium]
MPTFEEVFRHVGITDTGMRINRSWEMRMIAPHLGVIALVGAGASEGWMALAIIFGSTIGIVVVTIITAWLTNAMSAGTPKERSSSDSEERDRKRRLAHLPFIPSSW